MKKLLFFLVLLIWAIQTSLAQTVVISDNAAYSGNSSSLLDVHSASGNLGILIPQVDLSSATDNSTISSPANGLMIFNKGTNINEGLYYWSSADSQWKFLYSGNVPSIPGNVVYWIRPDGKNYIQPEYNENAKVFDAGQNYAFFYEGSNKHGSFFAGDDVGVIGERAGLDTSEVPLFTNDIYPFVDMNGDAAITSDDSVTYSGIYGYGQLFIGVTGIAKWDAGVRGIGLATYEDVDGSYYSLGTNSYWPVVGVMGEVLDVGYDTYGQQGVYGWQEAPAGSDDLCIGVLGRTSQSGNQSAGVAGYYTTSVGDLTTCFTSYSTAGFIGLDGYGVYSDGDIGADGSVYITGTYNKGNNPNGIYYLLPTSKGNMELPVSLSTGRIIEDYGSSQLVNGKAIVKIDPLLMEVISNKDYQVFIQMTGRYNQEVYVEKHDEYFEVIQKNGGSDNSTFDWHLVAKQKGTNPNKCIINNEIKNPISKIEQKKELPHIKIEK